MIDPTSENSHYKVLINHHSFAKAVFHKSHLIMSSFNADSEFFQHRNFSLLSLVNWYDINSKQMYTIRIEHSFSLLQLSFGFKKFKKVYNQTELFSPQIDFNETTVTNMICSVQFQQFFAYVEWEMEKWAPVKKYTKKNWNQIPIFYTYDLKCKPQPFILQSLNLNKGCHQQFVILI